jgi:hypothetical protein
MTQRAPVNIPVEMRRGGRARWFRLATEIGERDLVIGHVAPESLDGPLDIAFHLPGDPAAIRCRGLLSEIVVGEGETERAERRLIDLIDLDQDARARITTYVTERLSIYA